MSALEEKFWCSNCGHKLALHITGKCTGIDDDNQICDCEAAAELADKDEQIRQLHIVLDERKETIAQLRAENKELRESKEHYTNHDRIIDRDELAQLKEQNAHLSKMLKLYEEHSDRVYNTVMSINKRAK